MTVCNFYQGKRNRRDARLPGKHSTAKGVRRETSSEAPMPTYVYSADELLGFTDAKLFLYLSPFILLSCLFRPDLAAAGACSPLPYNRLVNQYNIFTERDLGERYCPYRETLSKTRRTRRRRSRNARLSLPLRHPAALHPLSCSLSLCYAFLSRFLSFAHARTHRAEEEWTE